MDVGGFDSSIILIRRGGIPRPIGDFPESLSQAILVGMMLVGRLGAVDNDAQRVELGSEAKLRRARDHGCTIADT